MPISTEEIMNIRLGLVIAATAAIGFALPAAADGLPKFGKTCIGKSGWNTDVCLASNGKTVSSTYKWKGSVATKGKHTGCTATASAIRCSGGSFSTPNGSGAMDPITVTVKNGKPSAIKWN
jgi:hypothetical protein